MRDMTCGLILMLLLLSGLGCSSIEYQVYNSVQDYKYISDIELYGCAGVFGQLRSSFFNLKKGDCEAYAGLFFGALRCACDDRQFAAA